VLDEIDSPTPTEEQIEEIAEQVTDDAGRSGIVADRAAEETATQEQFNAEVAQSVGQELPDDTTTGVGVIEDTDGNVVGVFGGTSGTSGRGSDPDMNRRDEVLQDMPDDVRDLGGSAREVVDRIEKVETGNGVEARIDGQTIREVSPE